MNIHEFQDEANNSVKTFIKFWMEQHQLSPDYFPLHMQPGEWWEQYMTWMTGGGE